MLVSEAITTALPVSSRPGSIRPPVALHAVHDVDAVVDPHAEDHRRDEGVDVVEVDVETFIRPSMISHAADELGHGDRGQPQAAEVDPQQHEDDDQPERDGARGLAQEDAAELLVHDVGAGDDDAAARPRCSRGDSSGGGLALPARVAEVQVGHRAHTVARRRGT